MVRRACRMALRAVGAAFGVVGLVAGTAAVVVIAVVAAALGAGVGYALAARAGVTWPPSAVRFAVRGGAGVLVVAGMVVVVGPLAVPLAGVALAALVWRHRNSGPDVAGTDLQRLSNAELGREWQRSHQRLRAARTADELGRVTTLRRHQLDEIERRDPVGCREWLAGGEWDSVPFLGI
jgi:hypothetical protein